MAAERKITLDVVKGYLNCRYLAHLLFDGQEGVKSDYEIVLAEIEQTVRLRILDRLHAHYSPQILKIGVVLDSSILSSGAPFVLDSELRGDGFSIRFDGLKRVNGSSNLGDFHYVPLMFCGTRQIRRPQRLLLEFTGLFLSRIQGVVPSTGIIYCGLECAATTVRFTSGLRAAKELLDAVTEMQQNTVAPKFLLNPHCPACEFRSRCHKQAVKQDSLSLLRGVKEKELKLIRIASFSPLRNDAWVRECHFFCHSAACAGLPQAR